LLEIHGITPQRLGIRLLVYFALVIGALGAVLTVAPWAPTILPFGGLDLVLPGSADDIFESLQSEEQSRVAVLEAAFVLIASLSGTIILMIPITWVYMAAKLREGFQKSFVRALIALPICATSIVLLVQNSLALAFGVVALVAAVRFRVALRDPLDGIYIFAAICVGVASGVGYLGVGIVMTVFFCFASVVLWGIDYGANPLDDVKQARKLAKLETTASETKPPRRY